MTNKVIQCISSISVHVVSGSQAEFSLFISDGRTTRPGNEASTNLEVVTSHH